MREYKEKDYLMNINQFGIESSSKKDPDFDP